jgi:hypothetical protein
MCGTKAQAVQGYNEQVQQMKLNAKNQDIFCSLVTFNGEVFEHQWCEEASKLNEATAEDYLTEGSTAMRDAIGYTVEKLMKTTDTKDENTAYLVVVISDGEENASRHHTADSLRELIEPAQKSGKWTFTYMGCDAMYLKKVAQETSIPVANMAMWSNATPELATRGMVRNRKCLDGYYDSRKVGCTASANVYSADSCCLADFTTEDSSVDDAVNKILLNNNPPLNPNVNLTVDQNVLNVNNLAQCGGTSPFNNYAPVSWKA